MAQYAAAQTELCGTSCSEVRIVVPHEMSAIVNMQGIYRYRRCNNDVLRFMSDA